MMLVAVFDPAKWFEAHGINVLGIALGNCAGWSKQISSAIMLRSARSFGWSVKSVLVKCRADARLDEGAMMVASVDDSELAETLISVWRQVLVEGQETVKLGGRNFPVGKTGRSRLRVVNFEYEGQKLVGIEQNPDTASRWAAMARQGSRIMQFSLAGRYIANVADGRANFYRRGA